MQKNAERKRLILPDRESPSILVPKFNFGTQLGCEVELRNP